MTEAPPKAETLDALVLWDIDGTLIRSAGLGSLAFLDACERVLGSRPPDHLGEHMAGKTDPQIARGMLEALGVDGVDGVLPRVLAALEESLALLAPRIRAEGWVLPGVRDVLARLAAHERVAQSVLTGNLISNARVKLAALGVDPSIDFEIGAYGSDDADRCRLVPVALERLAASGRHVDRHRVWVVGDTPRDLECARAGGVRCLLVATGGCTYDDLAALPADAVLADLSEVDTVVGLLTGAAT